ncbi:ParB/RepB/Spo0J family partition protein [Vibrio anguillarum]
MKQVRTKFRGIEELSQSIETEGQHQPITIYARDGKGYRIHQGERRWRAAGINDSITHLDCIVREGGTIWGQITENIQRDDLDPFDIAFKLKEEMDNDATLDQNAIAEKLSKSPAWVTQHLKLLQVPDYIFQAYDSEVIGDIDTVNSLRVAAEIDPKKVQTLLNDNGGKPLKRDTVKAFTRQVKQEKKDSIPGKAKAPKAKEKTVQEQAVNSETAEPVGQPVNGVMKNIQIRFENQVGYIDLSGEAEPSYIVIHLADSPGAITVPANEVELIGYVR